LLRLEIFCSLLRPDQVWGPTQPPLQWDLVVSTEVKQQVLNDYHLTASNAEVTNVWGFTRLHNIVLQYGYNFVLNTL
jgi:hypothetical protein